MKEPREDGKLTFEFKGETRTTIQSTKVFFVNSGEGRKVDALGDRKEAEKRGLGKTVQTRISFGWDGKKLANYWSNSIQASYRNPATQLPDYYFDPRVLGIDLYYIFSSSIARCCGLEEPRSVDLVGEERIGDRKAWRIKVTNQGGSEFHYWVEGKSPFRVLRKKYPGSDGSSEVVDSHYDWSSDSPLPDLCVTKRFNSKNELTIEVTMKVTKAELNRPVSEKVGTLASLDVPPGTEVYGEVEQKRLGYWNGTDIADTKKEAEQQSLETITGEPQGRGHALWYWMAGVVAAIVSCFAVWRFRRRSPAP